MASTRTKIGHGLAKALGIKVQKSEPYQDEVTRGESVFSVATAETFIEEPPTTAEFIREMTPSGRQIRDYIWSLFPFLHWIGYYNLQWLIGDLVAGEPLPKDSSVGIS
jgi:sodium-independent sulfate anion transporter 11